MVGTGEEEQQQEEESNKQEEGLSFGAYSRLGVIEQLSLSSFGTLMNGR